MEGVVNWLAKTWRGNWLFLLVIGALVVAFVFLRTPASAVASTAEIDAILGDGHPTLVEFYSNT